MSPLCVHALKKCWYEAHVGQIFLGLTRFLENINNICISKYVDYENILEDLFNDINMYHEY